MGGPAEGAAEADSGQRLTGLACALLAEGGRATRENAWQITTGHTPANQPAQNYGSSVASADYWTSYLKQLQLANQPVAAHAAAAHAQLLQALSSQVAPASSGSPPMQPHPAASSGLLVPKPIRPYEQLSSTPLSDLAAALRRQALPSLCSPASAFSLPSTGGHAAAQSGAAAAPADSTTAGIASPTTATAMRRQSSDGLQRGSSGSLPASSRPHSGASVTGKRSGKRTARETLSMDNLPFKKRPDLNRVSPPAAVATPSAAESAEEGAQLTLACMRSGEASPTADGSDKGQDPSTPTGDGSGGAMCSKEKNRQAQRRFRERQKNLIGDLRENVRALQADLEAQAKQIFVLQDENRLLKMLLSDRQGQPAAGQLQ